MASCESDTPTGRVTLTEEDGAITRLVWSDPVGADTPQPSGSALLDDALRQLEDYFAGRREAFDVPMRVLGSDFQRAICAEMLLIPFGETRTYGDIAARLGCPPQAVGQGCGGNPIPILIPCHRVLAANGLGGFSGAHGIETKVQLLRLEGAASLLI